MRWIERGRPAVLALGGGAFATPPTATDPAKTASPSGSIARSTGCSGAWRRHPTGRWRATPAISPRSTNRAATALRLADVRIAIESDDPEVRRRDRPVNHPMLREMSARQPPAQARPEPSFDAALAAADPVERRGRASARRMISRASAISTSSAPAKRARPWRRPPSACWAAASPPAWST